ncbi:DUF6363 domain-containing protein [Aliivibrio logei]|uniref:DUF6363 domain-containing protein n=1 Tax=Aliivibrio logei TaxID=688 RepID=UPI0035C89754
MDLDWLIDKTESDIPLNWKVGEEHLNTKQVLAVAAHATNFETKYFDLSTSNWKDILRASCAIPALHKQPVIMDDKRWLDGGLTTPIPVQAAYDRGFRHIVVIRTVPVDFTENHDWLISLAKMTKNSTLDHMAAMLVTHEENYRKTQAFLANPPDDVIIYEISPNRSLQSKVLGSTKKQLDADYHHGKDVGKLFLETIAAKLNLAHLSQERFLVRTREAHFIDEAKQQEYKVKIDAIWNNKKCGEVLGVERIPLKWINVNLNDKKQTPNLLDVLASKPNYALGQSHFKKVQYKDNVLTHIEPIAGAYHDMLIEKDTYRDIAINKLLDFYTSDYRYY